MVNVLSTWHTTFKNEAPTYCVVQVNNVFENPDENQGNRPVASPWPQVVFQYYDGLNGDLRYAEAVLGK